MTKQEAIANHRKKWSWCAKTGKLEIEWPGWEFNGGQQEYVNSFCFLCHYVFDVLKKDISELSCTRFCPLKWPNKRCSVISCLINKQYLFDLWNNETDIEKRKEYATQIALLDER